jgi:uncharacterized protein
MSTRRRWLSAWPTLGGLALGSLARSAPAAAAASPAPPRLPGDPPEHHLVYQLNQAEPDHIEHILGSVGAMIGKYEDNVAITVVAFGPGIHLLAKHPKRPVPPALRERAASQAKNYGVRFVACGNTMKPYGWTPADIVDFADVEEVGVAVLMELQEQGWAYVAW